jgi:5-methylthioadenosine/S-adenosylhomocysteine deaminase
MGLDDQIGALREGLRADIAIVSFEGAHQLPVSDPQATLIFSSSGRDVVLTVVAGREIYRDGRVLSADGVNLSDQLNKLSVKICQD